jgi:hypothetical protein
VDQRRWERDGGPAWRRRGLPGKGTDGQTLRQATSRRANGVEHKRADEMHRGERERSFAPPLSSKAKMPHLLPPLLDGVFVMHSD